MFALWPRLADALEELNGLGAELPSGLNPTFRSRNVGPPARLTNQVRHRLYPGSPWEHSIATSRLRRDAACAA